MATRFIPSLQEIMYRLASAAIADASQLPKSENPMRFPVVVRPETRAFLEAQAGRLGGSIAGIAGSILDGVAMGSVRRQSGASAVRGIVERFNLLIEEHGLSYPGAAEALRDLGLNLEDFSSPETTLRKLTAETLGAVATRFFVEYEWLAGVSEFPVQTGLHAWYKQPGQAAHKMVTALDEHDSAELSIIVAEGTDLDNTSDDDLKSAPHFLPVMVVSKSLPGGETLERYELWEEGRWSYWQCEQDIKLAIYFATSLREKVGHFDITGRTVPRVTYEDLMNGRLLPATVMRAHEQITWHPDDYVKPNSPVAKQAARWHTIRTREENSAIFRQFDAMLRDAEAAR